MYVDNIDGSIYTHMGKRGVISKKIISAAQRIDHTQ